MVYPDIFEPAKEEEVGAGKEQQKEGSIIILKNS